MDHVGELDDSYNNFKDHKKHGLFVYFLTIPFGAKYGHFWVFSVCEKNFGEAMGPSEGVLSSKQY